MGIEIAIYVLLAVYVVNNTFVFRFQRTTLSISRVLKGSGDPRVQSALTPAWIGAMGWGNWVFLVALVVASFVAFNWIWSAAVLAYGLFGIAIIDVMTPVPSYRQCFAIIKRNLRGDLAKRAAVSDRQAIIHLLDAVESIEVEQLGS